MAERGNMMRKQMGRRRRGETSPRARNWLWGLVKMGKRHGERRGCVVFIIH